MYDKSGSITKVEKTLINLIPASIEEIEAKEIVTRHSENYFTQVQKLIYYPYYWFLFSFTIKTLFGKSKNIKASCLVDLINNHASTTDRFELKETEVLQKSILEHDYNEEQALKTAKTYLTHSSIHTMKVLFAPDYEIMEKQLVYKPFWIVKCTDHGKYSFKVIVDAVTGKFQIL